MEIITPSVTVAMQWKGVSMRGTSSTRAMCMCSTTTAWSLSNSIPVERSRQRRPMENRTIQEYVRGTSKGKGGRRRICPPQRTRMSRHSHSNSVEESHRPPLALTVKAAASKYVQNFDFDRFFFSLTLFILFLLSLLFSYFLLFFLYFFSCISISFSFLGSQCDVSLG